MGRKGQWIGIKGEQKEKSGSSGKKSGESPEEPRVLQEETHEEDREDFPAQNANSRNKKKMRRGHQTTENENFLKQEDANQEGKGKKAGGVLRNRRGGSE